MEQATYRSPLRGVQAGMLGLAAISAILLAVSLSYLQSQSGAMVAAIMLSGSVGIWTSLLLYRICLRSFSPRASLAAAIFSFAALTGGLLFLILSLI